MNLAHEGTGPGPSAFCIDGIEIKVTGYFPRIARRHGDGFLFIRHVERLVEALRAYQRRIELFVFTQSLADRTGSYSYPVTWHNVAALPVTTFDDWWSRQIDNKTRNMVRKTERSGVRVQEAEFDDALVSSILAIYNETPIRQGKTYPHYGVTLENVRRLESTHRQFSTFLTASLDDQVVGFIKLVFDEARTQAGIMEILGLIRHRDKAVMNGLLAGAVRACAERGISHLTYASFTYGNKGPDTLSDFKRNNGFRSVDVPRYFVPLSPLGSLAYHLGLHRTWLDRVPAPAIKAMRDIRANWYKRQLARISVG